MPKINASTQLSNFRNQSTPTTPPAGEVTLYAKNNSIYRLNSLGVEVDLGLVGGTVDSYAEMIGTKFGSEPAGIEHLFGEAWDGDLTTYFEGSQDGAFTGIDLGAGNSAVMTKVSFFPRPSWNTRMNQGKFQGSNDGITYTNIYTIPDTPIAGQYTDVILSNTTEYRYYRYLSPDYGYGNVSELKFYTTIPGDLPTSGALETQIVEVNFGLQEDQMVVTPVVANWVTATSTIIVQPAFTTTLDHDPEDYALEGIQAQIVNINPSVGFDLITSSTTNTWGRYNLKILYN